MKKEDVINKIKENAVVAVIRAENMEQGTKITEAVVNGGIKLIEITMTVPGALHIIENLSLKYKDTDVIIGAGTVLDSETARAVILAGAQFVVSPYYSEEVMRICNRYAIASIPGVMTVKEAVEALEMGASILKVFPGNAFEPSIISAFKGPLPQAEFMPTGGVNINNISQWFAAGAVAVGTGSNLTAGAKKGDYELVKETAEKFVTEVNKSIKNNMDI